MIARPPRFAEWLVSVSLPPSDKAAVLGDLSEEFQSRAQGHGARAARRWYWRQTVGSLGPNLRRRWAPDRLRPSDSTQQRGRLMDALWQDVRFGWRIAARRPLVTTVALFSLVLGMSMATVVFSLLNAVVLRPLQVANPHELAVILEQRTSSVNHNFPYPDFVDWRAGQRAFTDLVAFSLTDLTARLNGGSQIVRGEIVSGSFFSTLGIGMRMGRALTEADDHPGAPPVVVVSEGLWRRLGGGTSFERRTLVVNEREFAIVGVVDKSFGGMEIGRRSELWAPLRHQPTLDPSPRGESLLARRGASWLTLMGRRRPGVTDELAAQDLNRVEAALAPTVGRTRPKLLKVVPGARGDSGFPASAGPTLKLLLAAAVLVLIVACANVANLLLARAADRRRELAVRAALGAGWLRLGRLLFVEALLIGTAGASMSLVISLWAARLVAPLLSTFGTPVALDLSLDWTVAAFVGALGVGSTLLAGLAPVFAMTRTLSPGALGDGGRSATPGRLVSRLRRGLIVLQFALSLALVVSALLLLRTLSNLRSVPTGFDIDRVALLSVEPMAVQYDWPRARRYFEAAEQRLAAVPGVRAAAFGRVIPVGFGGSRTTILVPGYTPRSDEDMEINFNTISPPYFEATGIDVAAGRAFHAGDGDRPAPVAIVNESMARRYWAGGRAVGQRFSLGEGEPPIEVVGVARDVKYRMLREEAGPSFYLPLGMMRPRAGVLHVRTHGKPGPMLEALRRALAEADPGVPVSDARTLRTQADLNVNDERVAMTIGVGLGGAALLLAAVGLYGAMSYTVGQRTREIGVRLALGAAGGDIRRLVLGQGIGLAAVGSALGLGLAIWSSRLIESRLFGVTARDPLSFAAAMVVLAGVAMLAALAPARRAARVDPVVALRED